MNKIEFNISKNDKGQDQVIISVTSRNTSREDLDELDNLFEILMSSSMRERARGSFSSSNSFNIVIPYYSRKN